MTITISAVLLSPLLSTLLLTSRDAYAFPSPAFTQPHRQILNVPTTRTSTATTTTARPERKPPLVVLKNSDDDDAILSDDLSSDDDEKEELTPIADLPDVLDFELGDHVPLGCTVEESLAPEPDGKMNVFVSRVTEGGNAANAGIEVGDVIVALTGVFGEMEDVSGLGLDRVQDLVRGRPREKTLTVRVARGTDVYPRHEQALMELCDVSSLGQADDTSRNDCLDTIFGYEDSLFIDDYTSSDVPECTPDDADCMVDAMFNVWASDLPEATSEEVEVKEKKKKKKVMPWSSRSSPSGTYVRDPTTGKMRNIDEDEYE